MPWVLLVNKQILVKVLHVLKYLLGPATLVLVVWYSWHKEVDGKEVGVSSIFESEPHWGALILACAICSASMLLTFIRWYVLVRAQDMPFKLRNAIQLGMLGTFFSNFLPGSVTGDIPKMVFMAREQSRRTVAVATIMIDRIVGLVGLVWLAAMFGCIFWFTGALETMVKAPEGIQKLEFIVRTTWILGGGSIAFWILLGVLPLSTATKWISQVERIPKVGHSLAELCRATMMYRSRGRAVGLAMILAMIGHTGFALTFYYCSLSVNPSEGIPTLGTHFLIVPVGATIQSVMPTPGGMGFGELAFGLLYKWVGGVDDEGIKATIMQRFVNWLLAAAGFIVYWRMGAALKAAAEAQKAAASEKTGPIDSNMLEPVRSS
jgi:uncharacterized protein (TIRG00374 family)